MTKQEIVACKKVTWAAYRQKNKEKIAARAKACRQNNKEKFAAREKAYRRKNKEKIVAYRKAHKAEIAEQNKAYQQTNRAEISAKRKAYRQAHKEEIAASKKKWYEKSKDKAKAWGMAWRLAHKKKKAEQNKVYAKAHPDQMRDYSTRKRAVKRGATIEKVSRAAVYERDAGRCHICGKKVPKNGWHIDHIIPLARGGEHSYRNVAVSCPMCNMRKHTKAEGQLRLF